MQIFNHFGGKRPVVVPPLLLLFDTLQTRASHSVISRPVARHAYHLVRVCGSLGACLERVCNCTVGVGDEG